jgi:hypothetical protein
MTANIATQTSEMLVIGWGGYVGRIEVKMESNRYSHGRPYIELMLSIDSEILHSHRR